jgi:hypothetical protein
VHLLGVKRVLYIISGLLVHLCTPGDGHNDFILISR